MIKTLPFQCRGCGFSSWLGNQDATGCVAQNIKKIKINIFQATFSFRKFLHPLQGKSHILLWRSSFWSSFKELLTTTGLFTFYHEFTHPLYFSFTPSLARSWEQKTRDVKSLSQGEAPQKCSLWTPSPLPPSRWRKSSQQEDALALLAVTGVTTVISFGEIRGGTRDRGKGAAATLRQLPSNATRATLLPPLAPQENQAQKVTSVQHNVVDHVAFVFGVIEAERTAEIFGALLGDRRMPGFHVHSKSRSGRERGERRWVGPRYITLTPLASSPLETPCCGGGLPKIIVVHRACWAQIPQSFGQWPSTLAVVTSLGEILLLGWAQSKFDKKERDSPFHFWKWAVAC